MTPLILCYATYLYLATLYLLSAPRKATHGPFFWTLRGTVKETR
jgi:hypothetical protein